MCIYIIKSSTTTNSYYPSFPHSHTYKLCRETKDLVGGETELRAPANARRVTLVGQQREFVLCNTCLTGEFLCPRLPLLTLTLTCKTERQTQTQQRIAVPCGFQHSLSRYLNRCPSREPDNNFMQ